MSERDYQHKRFRARGSDSAAGSNSEFPSLTIMNHPVDKTPPRVVTPIMAENSLSPVRNGIPKNPVPSPDYLHKPTASKGSLTYISPFKPKDANIRYSLSNGLEEPVRLDSASRMSSTETAVAKNPTVDEKNTSKTSKTSSTSHRHSRDKMRTKKSSSSSSKLLSNSLRKHDPSSYKIFLLLLQPKFKTFELIQLIYSPNDTTIGKIIEMIPENATEPLLGNQVYTGLCRPKTREEITDKELLASESHTGVRSARITLGEILVAIPDGYNGPDVAVLAKQILANPKIVKLLKRADPLAPKRSRTSSKKNKSSRRSKSKEHVEVMEKFDEEDEIKQEQERKMKEAMEHAAQEAAAANALIPGGSISSSSKNPPLGKMIRSMSIGSVGEKSVESSLQESLDDSYSSWSKSFDASFASSICSGVSKRQWRRRERQVRRSRILKRAAVMAFIIMLALYFLDPRGYSRPDKERSGIVTETPMGLSGIFQCLFLLLALYKVERFIRSSSNPEARKHDGQKQSRCPFIKAANSAAKKFKSRYAKKLKKPLIQGNFDDDDQSLSRKLRSFSLKTNSYNRHHHNHHHDDMGSN